MVSKETFKREYIKAIRDGNAAVFAGAGLSRPSGFVLWKELLRPLAEEIGLNIDDEPDLTAVAQYVRNHAGSKGTINKSILDAFSKDVHNNENVMLLTRLPIFTYWTTNYDRLIEEGLRAQNRNPDVKMDYKQLSNTKRDRDAVVYKMHGDCEHPGDAVLTKDDYIRYDYKYPFFREVLQGDLISKTFVFVGFSFEDPNLDSILAQINLKLKDDIRDHYCFMRRIKQSDFDSDEEYGYQKAKQELKDEDLKRFGIQIVYVDDYSEITDIFKEIEKSVLANNVFISGSADIFEGYWTKGKVEELAYTLSKTLVKEAFKITSGFGLGIGSSIINGALSEIYTSKYKHMEEHLCLRPFPQGITDAEKRIATWKKYREDILTENGVAIFVCGNKNVNEGKVIADGCLQEFEIAKEKGCIIIPIGTTGDAAKQILNEIKQDMNSYSYLKNAISVLEEEKDIDTIVNTIVKILEEQRKTL